MIGGRLNDLLISNEIIFSSRSSNELNEQVFEEYNSNNNDEERISKTLNCDTKIQLRKTVPLTKD